MLLVHAEALLAADIRHLELAAPESEAAALRAVRLPEDVEVDVDEQGADGRFYLRPRQSFHGQAAAERVVGQLGQVVLLLALRRVLCKVEVKVMSVRGSLGRSVDSSN